MIIIDNNQVIVGEGVDRREYALGSREGFGILSKLWLRAGWDAKYVYSFSWLGRPIIQLPEDMIRIQEILWRLRPDVIVETGVAHGGSLIFYASLCKAMEKGRVIGVDIAIRPSNRRAIEEHQLSPFVKLIEGSSIDSAIVSDVASQIQRDETVIVLLDSCHSKQHVLAELTAYAPLVTYGSYIVAMDGIMEELVGAPRAESDWIWNNPKTAALEFVEKDRGFVIEEPPFPFNEGDVSDRVTYWPSAFIKRVSLS